jgi:hypothetical protein
MKRTISKITVSAGGLKGLILEGTRESAKENKIVTNTFKDGIKHPVNRELEDKIKEFRFFALDICGLITDDTKKAEKVTLLEGCDVLAVEFEKGDISSIAETTQSNIHFILNKNLELKAYSL